MSRRASGRQRSRSSRPRAPSAPPATPAGRRLSIAWAPLLALLVAAVLTSIDIHVLQKVWHDLPISRVRNLDRAALRDIFTTGRSSLPPEAYEGLILTIISDHFTAGWRDPAQLPDLLRDARAGLSSLNHTALGRVQVTALLMLELEHAGTDRAQWWPRLAPYLDGLETAKFPHFLVQLVPEQAQLYRRAGLGVGSAVRAADTRAAAVHGPLLEYFTRQMLDLSATLTTTDQNDAAQKCQMLTCRLLRELVLDPGPPTLRWLSAELLADVLDAADPSGEPPADLAATLRAWRTAGIDARARCAVSTPLVNTERAPELCPGECRQVLQRLALATTLASALVPAGTIALLLLWGWFGRNRAAGLTTGTIAIGVALGVLVIIGGILWPRLAPVGLEYDSQRAASDELGWPLHPAIVALTMLALLLLTLLIKPNPAGEPRLRYRQLAATATMACAIIAGTLLGANLLAAGAVDHYEQTVAHTTLQTYERIPAAAGNARLLDPLRAWQP